MFIRRSHGLPAPPRNKSFKKSEPYKRTIEKALRDAGFSRSQAKTLLSKGVDATVALNGLPKKKRDAALKVIPQPQPQRDAVVPGPQDIIDNLMLKINFILKE